MKFYPFSGTNKKKTAEVENSEREIEDRHLVGVSKTGKNSFEHSTRSHAGRGPLPVGLLCETLRVDPESFSFVWPHCLSPFHFGSPVPHPGRPRAGSPTPPNTAQPWGRPPPLSSAASSLLWLSRTQGSHHMVMSSSVSTSKPILLPPNLRQTSPGGSLRGAMHETWLHRDS